MKRKLLIITIILFQISAFAQKKGGKDTAAPSEKKVTATLTTSDKAFEKASAGSNARLLAGSDGLYLYQGILSGKSTLAQVDGQLNIKPNKSIDVKYKGKELVNSHIIYSKGNIYAICQNFENGKIVYYKACVEGKNKSSDKEPKEVLSFRSKPLPPNFARFDYINYDLSSVMSPDSSKVLLINRPDANTDTKTETVFSVLDADLNVIYTNHIKDTTIKVSNFAVDNDGNVALFCANKSTASPAVNNFDGNGWPELNYRNYGVKVGKGGPPAFFIMTFTDNRQKQNQVKLAINHYSINNVSLVFRSTGTASLLYAYSDLVDKDKVSTFNQESEKGVCISNIDLNAGTIAATKSVNFTAEQVSTVLGEKDAKKNKNELHNCRVLKTYESEGGEILLFTTPSTSNVYARSIMAMYISATNDKTWFTYMPGAGWEDFISYKRSNDIEIIYRHCCEDAEKEETSARFGDKILAIATLKPDGSFERQTLLPLKEYSNQTISFVGNDRLFTILEGVPKSNLNKKVSIIKLNFK